jgi:protein involved in polysaccharide export with SLBB domain
MEPTTEAFESPNFRTRTSRAIRRKTLRGLAAAWLVVALLAGGCSSKNLEPPAGGPALPLGGFAPVSSVQPGEFRVGVGDTLRIRFLFHDELDSEPEVRRDGHVTITGLGDFQAYGLTTRELEQDIYRRASLTYRNPQVGVVVTKQSIHRAYVGGEVGKPGYVDLRPGMTALRAIFMTGGFRDTAKVDNVLHVRWADDGSFSAAVVDLKEVLETGDPRGDVMLTANDIVFVPKTPIANANLWVRQYIIDLLPVRQPTTRLEDFGL